MSTPSESTQPFNIVFDVADPDPNHTDCPELLAKVKTYLKESASFTLEGEPVSPGLAMVWVGAEAPDAELTGIPWLKLDEKGRFLDLYTHYSGDYKGVGLVPALPGQNARWMLQAEIANHDQWTEMTGGSTPAPFTDGDGRTWALAVYTGYSWP